MRKTPIFIAAALLAAVACSSAGGVGPSYNGSGGESGSGGSSSNGGSSSAGTKGDGGSETGGTSGAGAQGGSTGGSSAQGGQSAGPGGAGGSGGPDLDGGAFGGAGGGVNVGTGGSTMVDDACAAVAQQAEAKLQPADIIWLIDTSGSMSEETGFVQDKLNAFAGGIFKLGIDVHVVMVAEQYTPPPCPFGICLPVPPEGICIPAPLGSGKCPEDAQPPLYFHDTSTVASTDGPSVLIKSYPNWKQMLRQDSTKTIIAITDDDATSPPYDKSTFPDGVKGAAKKIIDDFTALDPQLLKGWKMNAIYSFTSCPSAANVGETWGEVVAQTGGVKGDLCTQDFAPIFNDMAKAIVQGSKPLDCQWKIPAPPMGQDLNTGKINVKYTSGAGQESELYYVDGQGKCDPQKGGWYFDNASMPAEIYACPASCQQLQADKSGKVDILFGCERKALDPK